MDLDHVFLIVSDSLRYDTSRADMSTLSKLAAEGIDVRRCYAPGAGTPSSMPGIMQSRLPIEHGGYGLDLPPKPATIAECLSNAGVNTLGLHSNVYTSRDAGFDRGFNTFADLGGFGNSSVSLGDEDGTDDDSTSQESDSGWRSKARHITEELGIREYAEEAIEPLKRWRLLDADPRADGSELFDATTKWLDDQSGPTFTWLQLMDTHIPYLPSEKYRPDHLSWRKTYDRWKALTSRANDLTDEEIDDLHALYRGEARYVDDLLKDFVDELQRRGLWESTALIFTSDHGELFGDRNVQGDTAMKHPNYLCEEISHVPLVIAGGDVESTTIAHPTSGMDIAPTITDLLATDPSEDWRGFTISSDAYYARNEVVSAVSHTRGSGVSIDPDALHIAVRDNERELLWWKSRHPTEYYLRTAHGIEPAEGGSEWESLDATAREASTLLDEVHKIGDVGGAVSNRLADLGYVEE